MTNQQLIYKALLLIACSFLVVYFFPKGAKFKYEFQKGKPWQYSTLYAPYDFSVLKSPSEIEKEKQIILDSQYPYYRADETIFDLVKKSYASQFPNFFSLPLLGKKYQDLYDFGFTLLDHIYSNGVLPPGFNHKGIEGVFLIKGNIFSTDTLIFPLDIIYNLIKNNNQKSSPSIFSAKLAFYKNFIFSFRKFYFFKCSIQE